MMRAIIGSEKRTLVEEAKVRMERARRKHQEQLVQFAELLSQEVSSVVLHSADLNYSRIDWDMATSETFKKQVENKYFLLGEFLPSGGALS